MVLRIVVLGNLTNRQTTDSSMARHLNLTVQGSISSPRIESSSARPPRLVIQSSQKKNKPCSRFLLQPI